MRLMPFMILIMFSVIAIKIFSIMFDQNSLMIGANPVVAEEKTTPTTDGETNEADKQNINQLLDSKDAKGLKQFFTDSEIKLLQSLKKRRDLLDKRERKIDLQQKLLLAAEQQIDAKIIKLAELEKSIKEQLGLVNKKEFDRFATLVKTYEAMKPKEAAAILSILDLSIMEKIGRAMSAKKLAPILAKMDTKSARALTIRLAQPPVEMTMDSLDGLTTDGQTSELPTLNLE